MSSISALSSSTSSETLAQLRQKLFTKIDTDSDGTVSKEEFVANRPKNVSEAQAAALYDKIDTAGTNALTEDQLSAGLEANRPARPPAKQASTDSSDSTTSPLSDDVLATLLQLLNQINSNTASNSDDAFKKLDTDGDGKISKSEFVAGRPSDVTPAQAASLFDNIDTEGTGSITAQQFADNAPPPPPASGDSSTDTSQVSSDQLISQLLKAIDTYVTNSGNYSGSSLGNHVSSTA